MDSRNLFQSTLPAWGETGAAPEESLRGQISIHSPRMGRDILLGNGHGQAEDFNPLSPHGERQKMRQKCRKGFPFQSTLPAWGETGRSTETRPALLFQSTLPAWGETYYALRIMSTLFYFNPLSPHGERRLLTANWQTTFYFNPLSPHGERPGEQRLYATLRKISIHSPRMGRDGVHVVKSFMG